MSCKNTKNVSASAQNTDKSATENSAPKSPCGCGSKK